MQKTGFVAAVTVAVGLVVAAIIVGQSVLAASTRWEAEARCERMAADMRAELASHIMAVEYNEAYVQSGCTPLDQRPGGPFVVPTAPRG